MPSKAPASRLGAARRACRGSLCREARAHRWRAQRWNLAPAARIARRAAGMAMTLYSSMSWLGSSLISGHDVLWRNSLGETCLRDEGFQGVSGRLGSRSGDTSLCSRGLEAGRAFFRAGAALLMLATATAPSESVAQAVGQDALSIKNRNVDVSRAGATALPRSEGDQALVD